MTGSTRTVVKSLRIEPELWAYVQGRAEALKITPNAWLIRCIKDAKKRQEGQ